MPKPSSVSLSNYLPKFDVAQIFASNVPPDVQNKFEAGKQKVHDLFASICIPKFDNHPEFENVGEVIFILRRAYCQSLIQCADELMVTPQLTQPKPVENCNIVAALEQHHLINYYNRYKHRLKLAFEMAILETSEFPAVVNVSRFLKSAHSRALYQWDREIAEICHAIECVKQGSNATESELDKALTEFLHDDLAIDVVHNAARVAIEHSN